MAALASNIFLVSRYSNMAGRNNNNRYLSTNEETKIFTNIKNITNNHPNINCCHVFFPVFYCFYFFFVSLQPCDGVLLILSSTDETSGVYLLQPLDGNALNLLPPPFYSAFKGFALQWEPGWGRLRRTRIRPARINLNSYQHDKWHRSPQIRFCKARLLTSHWRAPPAFHLKPADTNPVFSCRGRINAIHVTSVVLLSRLISANLNELDSVVNVQTAASTFYFAVEN